MAEAKRIIIKSREITGPFKRKDGKGEYKTHTITTADGESFSLFGTTKSENPTVNRKEVLGLDPGAEVQMISEKNEKFIKVLDLAVVGQAETDASPWEAPKKEKVFTKSVAPSGVKAAPIINSGQTTSKDTSMELSGLIQSLISTGHYHTIKQTELGSNTYINDKLIKLHVERLLQVKDELAQERGK